MNNTAVFISIFLLPNLIFLISLHAESGGPKNRRMERKEHLEKALERFLDPDPNVDYAALLKKEEAEEKQAAREYSLAIERFYKRIAKLDIVFSKLGDRTIEQGPDQPPIRILTGEFRIGGLIYKAFLVKSGYFFPLSYSLVGPSPEKLIIVWKGRDFMEVKYTDENNRRYHGYHGPTWSREDDIYDNLMKKIFGPMVKSEKSL